MLRNISRVVQSPDLDIVEQQAARTPRQSVFHCTTGNAVFTLLACGVMLTAAGFIIRDIIDENTIDNGSLLKTEDFAQGKMVYFSDNRVEYTRKKNYPGYLLDHEKLSVKLVRRN